MKGGVSDGKEDCSWGREKGGRLLQTRNQLGGASSIFLCGRLQTREIGQLGSLQRKGETALGGKRGRGRKSSSRGKKVTSVRKSRRVGGRRRRKERLTE